MACDQPSSSTSMTPTSSMLDSDFEPLERVDEVSSSDKKTRRIDARVAYEADIVKQLRPDMNLYEVGLQTGLTEPRLRRLYRNYDKLRRHQHLAKEYVNGPKERGFKRVIWALPPIIGEYNDFDEDLTGQDLLEAKFEALRKFCLEHQLKVDLKKTHYEYLDDFMAVVAFAYVLRKEPDAHVKRIYFKDVLKTRTYIRPTKFWNLSRMAQRQEERVAGLLAGYVPYDDRAGERGPSNEA